MFAFLLRPRLVLVAMVLAIPVAGSGACGSRTACFEYTPGEYMQNQNSCPSRDDALASFTDPSCPGAIVSVDGEGSFDGELCCYPVSYEDIVPDCGNTTGVGGAGGFTEGSGMTTTGSGVTTTVTCPQTCAAALNEGGPPCGNENALNFYQSLQTCAGCDSLVGDAGGPTCTGNCPSLCASGPLDPTCQLCLQNTCQGTLDLCTSN